MNKKEISSKSGGVSHGDNAQGNTSITGGVDGDVVSGDKKIGKQEIHYHYHQPPSPQQDVEQQDRRIFSVPNPHSEFFTGREDVLLGLERGFNSGRRAQALTGIGGIGKTQTAVEYAHRHRDEYNAILWGKAHVRETLTADFAAMAGLLNLPEGNAEDQSEAVRAVGRWLNENDDWLLILDNADDLKMAKDFIPASGKGHILLTTRAQATGAIATRHPLEKMSPLDGALFLLRRSKTIAVDAASDAARSDQREQAEILSKLLDGLPLALDQAAAYIEEKPSTIARYIDLYRAVGAKLASKRHTCNFRTLASNDQSLRLERQ